MSYEDEMAEMEPGPSKEEILGHEAAEEAEEWLAIVADVEGS